MLLLVFVITWWYEKAKKKYNMYQKELTISFVPRSYLSAPTTPTLMISHEPLPIVRAHPDPMLCRSHLISTADSGSSNLCHCSFKWMEIKDAQGFPPLTRICSFIRSVTGPFQTLTESLTDSLSSKCVPKPLKALKLFCCQDGVCNVVEQMSYCCFYNVHLTVLTTVTLSCWFPLSNMSVCLWTVKNCVGREVQYKCSPLPFVAIKIL